MGSQSGSPHGLISPAGPIMHLRLLIGYAVMSRGNWGKQPGALNWNTLQATSHLFACSLWWDFWHPDCFWERSLSEQNSPHVTLNLTACIFDKTSGERWRTIMIDAMVGSQRYWGTVSELTDRRERITKVIGETCFMSVWVHSIGWEERNQRMETIPDFTSANFVNRVESREHNVGWLMIAHTAPWSTHLSTYFHLFDTTCICWHFNLIFRLIAKQTALFSLFCATLCSAQNGHFYWFKAIVYICFNHSLAKTKQNYWLKVFHTCRFNHNTSTTADQVKVIAKWHHKNGVHEWQCIIQSAIFTF